VPITTTAQTLIKDALLLIGAVAQGESVPAAANQDGFRRLNELVDAWSIQRLTMTQVDRATTAIVADQDTYTIGPNGDFDIVRPTAIADLRLILNSATPPVEIPMGQLTDAAYQALAVKTQTNPLPTQYYYQPTLPLAQVVVWPVPTDATNELALYYAAVLAQFDTLTAGVVLPPGYARALRYGLALELAPEFGRPVTQDLVVKAQDSLRDIKLQNVSMMDLGMDAGLLSGSGGWYDITTDNSGR
jgi:hypothetical protein